MLNGHSVTDFIGHRPMMERVASRQATPGSKKMKK